MPLSSLGPEVIWDRLKDSGSVFSGQTNPHFKLFLGKMNVGFYVPKMKQTIQTVTNEIAKSSLCNGIGVHLCPRHGWSAYMWRYHWCSLQDGDFSQELHVYFSRTMPGLILHKLQQRGFVCVCLIGLPAVHICLLLKNVCRIMKRRIKQHQQQLESCMHQ